MVEVYRKEPKSIADTMIFRKENNVQKGFLKNLRGGLIFELQKFAKKFQLIHLSLRDEIILILSKFNSRQIFTNNFDFELSGSARRGVF